MATITHEIVTPSPVANATVRKGLVDGVHKQYEIEPIDGYVLHDNRLDYNQLDPDTMETVTTILGYTHMYVSCRFDYDFTANPYEFYAVPENDVPENQIYSSGNNHETI